MPSLSFLKDVAARAWQLLVHPGVKNIQDVAAYLTILAIVVGAITGTFKGARFLYAHFKRSKRHASDVPSQPSEKHTPTVESMECVGFADQASITFVGDDLNYITEITAEQSSAPILGHSETRLTVSVPPQFHGAVSLIAAGELIYSALFDVRHGKNAIDNASEVVATDLPLYEDSSCLTKISGVVGMLLDEARTGKRYLHICPIRSGTEAQIGDFVRMEPVPSTIIGKAWYRDPSLGDLRIAWDGSMLMKPHVMANKASLHPTTLSVVPRHSSLNIGDSITLTARGAESYGPIRRELDVTQEATWHTDGDRVAEMIGPGIIRASAYGKTTVQCSYLGFHASGFIDIEQRSHGDQSTYFEGLRNASEIAFDEIDNLYIANQSESIARVRREGGLEIALRIPNPNRLSYMIDCVAVSPSRDLYVNAERDYIHYFRWNGTSYESGIRLAGSRSGVKKDIALSPDGDVFVGAMGLSVGTGFVIAVSRDGIERSFNTRDSAHLLALGPDRRLYVPARNHQVIDIYDAIGNLDESILYPSTDNPGAILVTPEGVVYVGTFQTGTVWSFVRSGSIWNALKLPGFRGHFPLCGEGSTNGQKTSSCLSLGVPG